MITFVCPATQGIDVLYQQIEKRLRAPGHFEPLMPVAPGASTTVVAARAGHLDGVDFILQTSGSTTGAGHLVGLGAGAFLASEAATAARFGGRGRWLLTLPAHHVAGFQVLARSCAGGTFPVLAPSELPFRERKIATLAPRGGFVSLVPTQLSDLLEGDQDLAPLAELRAILVGGAPSSASLLRRARQAGLPVVTTYGMTETAGGCVYDGLPLQGVSVCTEGGRIRLSGPMLAAGYLDEPTSPAFSTSGGKRWHVTNDAGVFDGHLKVLGRLDDVIISGGVKVFARQVEETLATFPGVRRVAVLPVEGGRWGQQVGAIVEADFRVADHAEELRSHVGAALGRTAAPRIFVQHSVPMLASGKVDRLAGQALLDEPDWVK